METKSNSPIIIKNENGLFQLLDDKNSTLETKTAQHGLAIFYPYFENSKKRTFKEDLTYVQLLELVNKLNRRLKRKGLPQVQTSKNFDHFVQQQKYYINEQSQAGLTIKDGDPRWQNEFEIFKTIVNQEITRPLKVEQEKASFFMTIMKRAANFSVPGAGKTAMIYGTFAYLSSPKVDKICLLYTSDAADE